MTLACATTAKMFAFVKIAALQQADTIAGPLKEIKAHNVLTTSVRTALFVLRLRRNNSEKIRSLSPLTVYNACNVVVREVLRFAIRFPTTTISDACRGAYKSEILDRVLCPAALPEWQQLQSHQCGKPLLLR